MKKTVTLVNGAEMPIMGFGTWQLLGEDCIRAVGTALELGYRHIDTADRYNNHREVAKGMQGSGVAREDIFLTTKVWRDFLRHDEIIEAEERFLEELETEYLDLLLVHWPNTEIPIAETLGALKELQDKGYIRSFGLSNFTIPLLEEALKTGIQFVNNQVEFHPSLNQKDLKEFCDKNSIVMTAYCPLGQGGDLTLPIINDVAKKYDRPASQIILNWIMRKEIVVIPRSSKEEHIRDNLGAFEFDLSEEDMKQIDLVTLRNRVVRPAFAPFEDL